MRLYKVWPPFVLLSPSLLPLDGLASSNCLGREEKWWVLSSGLPLAPPVISSCVTASARILEYSLLTPLLLPCKYARHQVQRQQQWGRKSVSVPSIAASASPSACLHMGVPVGVGRGNGRCGYSLPPPPSHLRNLTPPPNCPPYVTTQIYLVDHAPVKCFR